MELFSLRLLLLTVPGATCYEDLRTFEGTLHETFQAATNAHGLLESDSEWLRCLNEAEELAPFASMVRRLFCYILVNCSPADPYELWVQHRDRLSDDYFYQLRATLGMSTHEELDQENIKTIYKHTLGDIDHQLQKLGFQLSDYPSMPQETISTFDSLPTLCGILKNTHLKKEHNNRKDIVK
jgi:hypothetical protein